MHEIPVWRVDWTFHDVAQQSLQDFHAQKKGKKLNDEGLHETERRHRQTWRAAGVKRWQATHLSTASGE